MSTNPLAGRPAPTELLVDVPKLVTAYYTEVPDTAMPGQEILFGTSGHRGSAFKKSFNESHILAIVQAVCDCRKRRGIDGPLFLGVDTHALSVPAQGKSLAFPIAFLGLGHGEGDRTAARPTWCRRSSCS